MGDMFYAKAKEIDVINNMEAKTMVVLWSLRYCSVRKLKNIVIETDFLSLQKKIRKKVE